MNKYYFACVCNFGDFKLIDVFDSKGLHCGTFEENSSNIPENCTIFDKGYDLINFGAL